MAELLRLDDNRRCAARVATVLPGTGVDLWIALRVRDLEATQGGGEGETSEGRARRTSIDSELASVLLQPGDCFSLALEPSGEGEDDLVVVPPSRWLEQADSVGERSPSDREGWPLALDPSKDPWLQMWNQLFDALAGSDPREEDASCATDGSNTLAARVIGVQPDVGIWILPQGATDEAERLLLVESSFAAQNFRPGDSFAVGTDRSKPWWRDSRYRTLEIDAGRRVRDLHHRHLRQQREWRRIQLPGAP